LKIEPKVAEVGTPNAAATGRAVTMSCFVIGFEHLVKRQHSGCSSRNLSFLAAVPLR
jgi:hypothetical protein